MRERSGLRQLAEKFAAAGMVLPKQAQTRQSRWMGILHEAQVFGALGQEVGLHSLKLAAGPKDGAGIA